jgi:hypothetical protein
MGHEQSAVAMAFTPLVGESSQRPIQAAFASAFEQSNGAVAPLVAVDGPLLDSASLLSEYVDRTSGARP